jgi:hypothetical protein
MAAFFCEEGVVMQYSRHEIVATLRRAGLSEAADEAMAELPDPVDLQHVEEWGMQRGITRDILVSQLGGSP